MANPNPTGLTVSAMNKEDARLLAMRERAEARRDRFLNARQRTIGVDVDALDQQCAELEAKGEAESMDSESRFQREQYVSMLIEQREAEEREMKRRERLELRDTWSAQRAAPKNQASMRASPIDPAACGPAALQSFRGEDAAVCDRSRLQKAQMKSWVTQQTAEKAAKTAEEKAEADRYAAYVRMLTERRGALEEEEAAEARALRLDAARDNQALAFEAAAQRADRAAAEAEAKAAQVAAAMGDRFLCEDSGRAFESLDGRVVRDMFKGYSKDQTAAFYAANDEMVAQKAAAKAASADEKAWASHAANLSQLIEEAEADKAMQRRANVMDHAADIAAQRDEQVAQRAAERAGRFGSVGAGFFDGFGTSVR